MNRRADVLLLITWLMLAWLMPSYLQAGRSSLAALGLEFVIEDNQKEDDSPETNPPVTPPPAEILVIPLSPPLPTDEPNVTTETFPPVDEAELPIETELAVPSLKPPDLESLDESIKVADDDEAKLDDTEDIAENPFVSQPSAAEKSTEIESLITSMGNSLQRIEQQSELGSVEAKDLINRIKTMLLRLKASLDQDVSTGDDAPEEADSLLNDPELTELAELLSGFEESDLLDVVKSETLATQSPVSKWALINGYMALSTSYNYGDPSTQPSTGGFRGLSRFRYTIQPELKYELFSGWNTFISARAFYDLAYELNGREQYETSYLQSNEREAELRELYFSKSLLNHLDIKFGRQIIAWGKSDVIRVVDVLNPLDLREPGMVDIDALRLPVTMARMDYYFDQWNVMLVAIPEVRVDKTPAFGSDYNPSTRPFPQDKPPSWEIGNMQYAMAWNGLFNKWDHSFYVASVYNGQPHFEPRTDLPGDVVQKFARIALLGTATNIVMGQWLLKNELAVLHGFKFFTTGSQVFSRSDFLLGMDYNGLIDTLISVEAVIRRWNNYLSELNESDLLTGQYAGQLAVRYSRNFMHETLQLELLATMVGIELDEGGFYRASLKYFPMDAVALTGGVLVYSSGKSVFFKSIADNDRVFFDIRYDF